MLGAIALLLLAFAGYIKAAPLISDLPLDPAFIGAALAALLVAHRLLGARLRPPHGTGPILLLWFVFLLGVPTGGWSDYSVEKIWKLFLLSSLAAFGALVLLRSPHARRWWLIFVVGLGVVMVALSYAFPNQEVADLGRLAVEGSNTLASGRAIGAAAVVLGMLALTVRRRRLLLLGGAALLTIATLATSSRGPVLAIAVAILGAAAVAPSRRKRLRVLLITATLALGAYLALANDLVSDRLISLQDNSADTRRALWRETSEVIASNPFGIGWGNLVDHIPAHARHAGEAQYSHNVILEVTAEAGWLAGIVLVVVLVVAARRQAQVASSPTEMAMLGLLMFQLVNAMVSGDVIDNRGFWVAVGAALASTMAARGACGGGAPRLDGDGRARGLPVRSGATARGMR